MRRSAKDLRATRARASEKLAPTHEWGWPLTFAFSPREEDGEDAPPLNESLHSGAALVGVFDGMGGAGSSRYNVNGQTRTGAWLSSRIAREATRSFFASRPPDAESIGTDLAANDVYCATVLPQDEKKVAVASGQVRGPTSLEAVLKEALQSSLNGLVPADGSTGLKGKLTRVLPTTIAGAYVHPASSRIDMFWAGDSRIYVLTPDHGLRQLSTDDLVTGANAMENLSEDSPLSNHLSADRDFVIHRRTIVVDHPFMVFAATDGCFGYCRTPAHFERLLLLAMDRASTFEQFMANARDAVAKVTGDDATLSGLAVGWDSLAALRRAMTNRSLTVNRLLKPDDDAVLRLRDAEAAAEEAKSEAKRSRETVWEQYRTTYESLAPHEELA